jgi:hypothetical protein
MSVRCVDIPEEYERRPPNWGAMDVDLAAGRYGHENPGRANRRLRRVRDEGRCLWLYEQSYGRFLRRVMRED